MSPSIPCRRFVTRNTLRGSSISAKLPDRPFNKYFQLSPLGCLASLQTWRHLTTKVGTTKNLPRMQQTRSVTVSCLAHFSCLTRLTSYILINEPKCWSHIHVFHYLAWVTYRTHILHRYAVFRLKIQDHLQSAKHVPSWLPMSCMSSSKTLILSLFASHVSRPYSVLIDCKPSVNTRISWFGASHV